MMKRTEGRRRWHWPVLAAGTAVLLAGSAAVAWAAVSPSPGVNTIGAGGYDVSTPGVTGNQEVVQADQYGLTVAGGRHGIKMCNAASLFTSAIGEHSGNMSTAYSVQYGTGVTTGCPAGELPTADLHTFPALAAVPFSHHVWVNESLVTKVKRVRLLICILTDRADGQPVPTPSPTESVAPAATGTGSPSPTAESGSGSPAAPASPSPTAESGSGSPAAPASPSQTQTPVPSPSDTGNLNVPGIGPVPGTEGLLPGDILKCRIIVHVFTVNKLLFEAQDLDAPVATPVAGDLAGVQAALLPVPRGTTFDHSSWGLSENTTSLVACAGGGFPISLVAPPGATYASAACQPVSVGEYATYATGAVVSPLAVAAPVTELISPSAGGALIAPNQSLSALNLGPHGTASDASTTGGHLVMFTANAPVT